MRDGPILIGFWLNFLLRNRVLPEPEHEKGLRKALLVVEQARMSSHRHSSSARRSRMPWA